MFIYIHTYIYIYIHIYIHTSVYICTCYISVYVHIYVHAHTPTLTPPSKQIPVLTPMNLIVEVPSCMHAMIYRVATVSRIDKIIGLFCKRVL